MTVSLVDYGLGNLGSVVNMLKRLGVDSRRVSRPDEILASDRVLLPGVGAYDSAVTRLQEKGLFGALQEFAATSRPFLGICLGMQLLVDSSDEGTRGGLGLIRGTCRRFEEVGSLRVPHMGWNDIECRSDDALVAGVDDTHRFYFVHSYHVEPAEDSAVLATTHYGRTFASIIRRENVMGAQFHPEKSHTFGMNILRNFSAL